MRKAASIKRFLLGAVSALATIVVIGILADLTITDRATLKRQAEALAALEEENRQLSDELFRPRYPGFDSFNELELPYDESADSAAEVARAREDASREEKFLMITFGANWCLDCRNLHHVLHDGEVVEYTSDLFRFVNVDVGKFNQNRQLATDLGVDLSRGIPVAIFYDPKGNLIGATNDGQLEPARHYSSKQILKFVRDIAERSRILRPDSVK